MELSSSPPPLAPPTTEEDKLSWLRLLRSRRVGPATFLRLMRQHGAATAALEALPGVAAKAGDTSYKPCPEGVVHAELRAARRAGARALYLGAANYPTALAQIHDPPPLLWAIGTPNLAQSRCVALIGARNASSMGLRMARAMAQDLGAESCTIVSGLARGIDGAAHSAALQTGTVAVLAGGVDMAYPSEHSRLHQDIAKAGLLVSERPPGYRAQARDFPRRNRIITGICAATVVVEAALRSGSLGTARLALDQGRDVMAVPGHPMDPRAAGCNMLIRDGAQLVRGAADILEALPRLEMRAVIPNGPAQPAQIDAAMANDPLEIPDHLGLRALEKPTPPQKPKSHDAPLTDRIMNRLGMSPVARDQLVRDLGQPPAAIESALTLLELEGRIERGPGGLVMRQQ